MPDELDNPLSQDLSAYDDQTQTTIQQLIADDTGERARIMAEIAGKERPAQIIGAVGFSSGINAAVAPPQGPI